MKATLKKYSVGFLYLSGLAAIVSVGLFVVFQKFELPLQISLGVMILGAAIYTILSPEKVRELFTGRSARYGSNALIMSLAFIGILVVLNYIVYNNDHKWDLTQDQENTLAPETIQVLTQLEKPITVQAFFTANMSTDSAKKLLENYKSQSTGKFDYQFIDPNANPVAAQEANITRDGTLVLNYDGRKEAVTTLSEEEITAGIIKVTNPGKRVVYFLTGHGEFDVNGSDETAYSQVKKTLESKNYTVESLNLISTPKIPVDALAVIVAGPKKPLDIQEVSLLSAWVASGKSLVYLTDPAVILDWGDAKDPVVDYLASEWGISLNNDMIIDPNVNPPLFAVANSYADHSITQKLQSMATVFPTAHSIAVAEGSNGVTLTELIKSSDNTWGETDLDSIKNNRVTFDSGKDIQGPVTLAASGENSQTNARVVVAGDADFASDQYFQSYGNGDFIINIVDWAAQQEKLINLTPKANTQRVLALPNQYTVGLLLFGILIVLPGLVLVFGIYNWVSRRRKG